MNLEKLPELVIGKIKSKLPIIQGGMSVGVSLSGLASAVANNGGIGVIGAAGIGMLEPDFNKNFKGANERALIKEIRKAREKSNGPIGVNIMVALSDYDNLLKVSVLEGIDLLLLGAGLPLKFPDELSPQKIYDSNTMIVPIISSARAGKVIFDYWLKHYDKLPDAVVVEGPKAGGHLGFKKEDLDKKEFQLENLVKDVMQMVMPYEDKCKRKIPVIAAGGIYTGADIFKFLKMGVSGVQMATRFVATHECDAAIEFKQMYVNAKKEDLVIIQSPVGLPGRAIKNEFITDVFNGITKPFKCYWKCLKTCDFRKAPYCIASALTNAKMGRLINGFSFAGANAYLTEKIVSVKEVFDSIKKEYEEAINSLKEKTNNIIDLNLKKTI